MKSAVLLEHGEPLVIEELTTPEVEPEDVRVRIEATGVCRSDLSVVSGAVPAPPPVLLGHEGAGTVVEVGPRVRRVRVGDRVVASFIPSCGECWHCLRDEAQLCEHPTIMRSAGARTDGSRVLALSGLGTFSDEMVVSEASVVRVESDLPSEQLALIGCAVTTGVGAVLNTADVRAGSTVAVIGCGGVGQFVVQGARIAGAARVIAIDPVPLKRTAAEEAGATHTVDPGDTDPLEAVRALTGGRGADHVFEVVGSPATVTQAYAATRRGGSVVLVGMPAMDVTVELPGFSLFHDEKRILGCQYGSAQVRRDFARWLDLVEAGRLDIASSVTRQTGLESVNEAMAAMERGEVIRTVIV